MTFKYKSPKNLVHYIKELGKKDEKYAYLDRLPQNIVKYGPATWISKTSAKKCHFRLSFGV